MTKNPLHQPAPDPVRAELQHFLDALRKVAVTSGVQPLVVQRGMLELLTAHALRSRRNVSLDEALDLLARELDINCLLLQPEYESLKGELEKVLVQFSLDAESAERSLTIIELFQLDGQTERRLSGTYYPPDWLVRSLAALAIPDEPLLFLDFGDATLAPRLLLHWAEVEPQGIEFVTLDRNLETVGNLRLMISLVVDDLEQVRESVLFDEQWLVNPPHLFDAPGSSLGSRQFGTTLVNLLSPIYSKPRQRAELNQLLPAFLSQRLTPNGRAINLGHSGLLDSHAWSRFRADVQERLHVEAIVDFSFDDRFVERAFAPVLPSLVILRQPQQSITRRVTVFAPSSPHDFALAPDNPLGDLIAYLEEDDRYPQKGIAFERPTSELVDRWDPRFYCPVRVKLQDELISSPQATWLGGITQLIAQGSSPSLLTPYITTRITGVTFEGRQEAIAHLKVGDQVWLRREMDNPYDPNAVHVERRSGASLGYLPAELAAEVAEAIEELGGIHKATVTRIEGGAVGSPNREVVIQFAPSQYA
ncbi:MAG: hypothetical protein E3J21_10110, partial [Anaerolineales bacterium]